MPFSARPSRNLIAAALPLGLSVLGAAPATRAQTPAPAVPGAPPVANPDIDQRVRELEETVRALRDEVSRLRSDKPATEPGAKAPATAAAPRPPAAAGQEGFVIQSPDGDFRLRLRGLLHSDLRLYTGRGGDTGTSTFFLRRARPILEGTVYKNIDFRIMPDFAEGRTVLQDAYLDLRFRPEAALRLGKTKAPFSLERLQGAADVPFVERSIANNLAPNRDIGVQLFGDVAQGTVSYALGVYNGVPDGGSGDADTNDDKDIVARVFAQPFRNQAGSALQGLGLGLAVTSGRQKEALSSVNLRTASRSSFFRYADAVTADGERTRLAPQFYFYNGPVGLLGEYITSRQRVRKGDALDTLTHDAFTIQGTYLLTGEKAGFRNPNPLRPYDPATGGAGAFELAARYAQFRADEDAFRLGFADATAAGSEVDAYTIGLNWYLNRFVKAQFNYERTDFGRGLRFGSAADTREHEDVLLSRFQIGF